MPDTSVVDAMVMDIAVSDDTASDSVTPPGDAAPMANLQINQARMQSSAMFEYHDFGPASCDIIEECLRIPGRRRLLRFDLETPNVGDADVFFGRPAPTDPRFEFSTCHGHRHFRGYAEYALLRADGTEVARGHKQSFCLEDTRRTNNPTTGPATARYTCDGDQGIQSGWADVYGRYLDCQYVDVTDVPPGNYRLRARVNVAHGIVESNYDDNEAIVPITITEGGDAGTPDGGMPMDITTACAAGTRSGVDRDCGWTAEGTHSCTPGTMIQAGCNASCTPAIGSCTGDTMMRVCPGGTACSHLTAIAQNDDSCGTLCSRTIPFACPASGMYTVLTTSFDLTAGTGATAAYTCVVQTATVTSADASSRD